MKPYGWLRFMVVYVTLALTAGALEGLVWPVFLLLFLVVMGIVLTLTEKT